MTALEIYQQDIADQNAGTLQPRQQYYTALRDELHRELTETGFSELLDQLYLELRQGRMKRIYAVDYAVLMECHSMIVLGQKTRDASTYVPHLTQRTGRVTWDDLEASGNPVMQIPQDMQERLRQLRAVSRQMVAARDDTVLPRAEDAAQRDIDQVHALNRLLDERCRELTDERDALLVRVKLLEDGVITEHVRHAIEARRVQEEATLQRSIEAQQDAAREAFRAQYEREQAEARRLREEEAEQDTSSATRQELAAGLRDLSALLKERLAALEDETRQAELRMLAACYVGLEDLMHRDLEQLTLEAQCAGTDAAVMAAIAQVETGLAARLRQLEQAMGRLGLTVLRPGPGEAFRAMWHIAPRTAAPAEGMPIRQCIHPGVTRQGDAEALIKAEVDLLDRTQP